MGAPEDAVCSWRVTAGFEPDTPEDRFTTTFVVTSEDWGDGDDAGYRLRKARCQEALSHAERLMSDELLAWVQVEYRSQERVWSEGSSARA